MEPFNFDDDDDGPTGLELLQQMRHQLEELESSQVAARDPKTKAAATRLLEQERTGEVDDESDQFDDDLRLVTLGLMRIDFEAQKANGKGRP